MNSYLIQILDYLNYCSLYIKETFYVTGIFYKAISYSISSIIYQIEIEPNHRNHEISKSKNSILMNS
jgi:hypothetical protein